MKLQLSDEKKGFFRMKYFHYMNGDSHDSLQAKLIASGHARGIIHTLCDLGYDIGFLSEEEVE